MKIQNRMIKRNKYQKKHNQEKEKLKVQVLLNTCWKSKNGQEKSSGNMSV